MKTFLLTALACPLVAVAAVIGTNPPSQPLSAERIAALPAAQQPAWRAYLERSQKLRAADQAFLADEIKRHGIKEKIAVTVSRTSPRITGSRPAAWFGSTEARTMADNVVSFQTPAGGWSKNFNTADHARRPGEAFSPDTNISKFLTPDDNDKPEDAHWSYIGSFDNNATINELRFLAKVSAAADAATGAKWRAAFLRGIDYALAAQYPNGGWPQNFPLDGGYHDAITFNDGALTNIIELMRDVGDGKNEFAWVPAEIRARATAAEKRGIDCILACQIVVDGRRTVWCQQHDMLTLAPTSARNYEMPSQSGGESAGVAIFLMELPDPDARVVAAVHAAVKWFNKTQLREVAFRAAPDGSGRKLLDAAGAAPTWSRYYQIGTDRPIFGDRDKTIHDDVNEISQERRNGYSWFNNGPQRAIDRHAKWSKAHPEK